MKIQIPVFGKMIPLDIDESKIPGLVDQLLPLAGKVMGQAKENGIDLTPLWQKMIGSVATPTPAPMPVEKPQEWTPPPEGWVRDHTGALVELKAITQAIQQQIQMATPAAPPPAQVPVVRNCSNCARATPYGKPSLEVCVGCLPRPDLPMFIAKPLS